MYLAEFEGGSVILNLTILFEAKDISMTTRTLGSDERVVRSYYYLTPL